jgi:hypothetical protein
MGPVLIFHRGVVREASGDRVEVAVVGRVDESFNDGGRSLQHSLHLLCLRGRAAL